MSDILIDAGPLIAILDRNDSYHLTCSTLIRQLNTSLYTTLPAITEAMYIAGDRLGWFAQEALWKLVLRGDLLLEHPSPADLTRTRDLMAKYKDLPMDFADASLVALAERLSINRIFTVDRRDFSIYRLQDKHPFTIIGP